MIHKTLQPKLTFATSIRAARGPSPKDFSRKNIIFSCQNRSKSDLVEVWDGNAFGQVPALSESYSVHLRKQEHSLSSRKQLSEDLWGMQPLSDAMGETL